MKTSKEFPPNYEMILSAFPDCVGRAVFCHGDTVYNPFGVVITPDLMEHEEVHSKRQGSNPETWWDRYVSDPAFRLAEEIPAFAAQYNYVRSLTSNKYQKRFLEACARNLAGPLYGSIIGIAEAEIAIKRHAKAL